MNSLHLVTFVFGVAALLSRSAKLRAWLNRIVVDILSCIINYYLLWKYPITSVDGTQAIPTCPYRWPNGQGDVAKFLEGEKNSALWGEKFGRVYRIWSGMTPEIVVGHPDDVQTIFKDSDKHYKAVNNDAGWLMGELLGKCVGLISGADYRRLRSVTAVSFTHKTSASYTPMIVDAVEEHVQELQRIGNLQKGLINPVVDLRVLPFWIVANVLYGTLTEKQREELKALVPIREGLWARMIQGGATRSSWSRYLSTETNKNLRTFKKRWAAFNKDVYLACKLANETAPIVAMYGAVEAGTIGLEELLQTIDEMLFANLDVTMGGLSWNLLFLASNQDIQNKIREELPTFGEGEEQTRKLWEAYITDSSTLLAASVLESGRLKPLAAFSVPQSAPTARAIGGYMVPANTNIVVDTHALNIRNPYWGDDREKYRPSKFLERKTSELRYQYWRFGFGPRQCLGKYVVDTIIRATLAHLVANYRLSLLETSSWDKNPETWIAHPDTEIRCQRLVPSD